jgi:ribosomal protein L25 (general stress protein Ctc)
VLVIVKDLGIEKSTRDITLDEKVCSKVVEKVKKSCSVMNIYIDSVLLYMTVILSDLQSDRTTTRS